MRLQQAVMPVQRVLNGPDYLPRKGLSPFMTRREAVARSLGFNALSGIRIERRLGRDESMYHGAITMRKASQKAFNTLRKEELFKKPKHTINRRL
ncbi:hypothetical protein DIPPA_01330 [Diplonema papillatum]|nr:hypothetical protein DIPPA_01330 [Diplonema papillatum]